MCLQLLSKWTDLSCLPFLWHSELEDRVSVFFFFFGSYCEYRCQLRALGLVGAVSGSACLSKALVDWSELRDAMVGSKVWNCLKSSVFFWVSSILLMFCLDDSDVLCTPFEPPTPPRPPLLPPWIPLGHELRASFWNFLLVLGGLWKSKTGGQYLKDMSFLIICLLRDLGGWGQWVLGQMFSKPNFAACFSHYWRSVCALLTWGVACAWVLVWQRNSVWWHYIQIFTLTFDLFHYFH